MDNMHFVNGFDLFGVKAKQIPCITGNGSPTVSTSGAVGMLYMDTSNEEGELWKCIKVEDSSYTWVKLTPNLEGYAKKENIPTKPEDIGAQPAGNYLTSAPVTSVNGKNGNVNLAASDVGADPKGTASNLIGSHNSATDAHNDLRIELKALSDRLNAFFDSDDQTLDTTSEIVAYIKNNKTIIEAVTTSKVNVSDIVHNLSTNVSNKPLSAGMGVELKALIDGINIPTKLSQLQNDEGYLKEHQDISDKVNKTGLYIGVHTDGLLYLFIDGQPTGTGIELPAATNT